MPSSIHVDFLEADGRSDLEMERLESLELGSDDPSSYGFPRQSSNTLVNNCGCAKTPHELAACVAAQAKEGFDDSMSELLASFPTRDVIAPFKKSEVKLGRLLGSGEFSHVYEIKSFDISSSSAAASASNKEEHELRHFMKSRELYRETKKARYAVKHLRPELVDKYDSNEYSKYASDIVIEAEFLSMLQHPNIMRLRGISDEGSAGLAKGPSAYFLIIDKLDETLDDRIETWKKRYLKKKSSFELLQGSVSSLTGKKKKEDDGKDVPSQLAERLEIALQLAAAVNYLHSKGIIFRDLKPANCGFDVRGDLKLFDFGLAKLMPTEIDPYEDLHKMSMAGTPRYMSPEALGGKAYNLKADVYTFGIVLWQILSLHRPFVGIRNNPALIRHVVREEGRPDINDEWPASIKDLLRMSFDSSPKERPTMHVIFDILRCTLSEMRGGDVSRLSDSYLLRRRTIASTRNLVGIKPARRSPSTVVGELRASLSSLSKLPKLGRKTTV